MVNILVGNKNTSELDILCQKLTNEKNYRIENVDTGKDIITTYLKTNTDILILDHSLSDMTIEDIIDRLSSNPLEKKKCNIILTLPQNYNIRIKKFTKINEIIYKPFVNNELNDVINEIAIDYNTPDLEVGEIDWLLQSLNFNCLSGGYKYIKKAIIYCYYKPEELEFLNTILKYLAFEFNTTETQVRDSMNACIRPFNNSNEYTCSNELYKVLNNNGYKLTLKDFLQRIVFYLIRTKKKGRIF